MGRKKESGSLVLSHEGRVELKDVWARWWKILDVESGLKRVEEPSVVLVESNLRSLLLQKQTKPD